MKQIKKTCPAIFFSRGLIGLFLLGTLYFVLVLPQAGLPTVSAETETRGLYGSTPIEVLDKVAGEANKDYEIQETALNYANDAEGGYTRQYKIANTLDYLRNNIAPYLQRAVYIGLVVAVILIIYNGLLMVTNALHKEGDIEKVKKRLINITIGVLLLTGFYAIIKIAVGLINSVFGTAGGSSGF